MVDDHNQAIAREARAALTPLGFRRKGRSRTWFADHGYWLLVVEFQPSAWSKGSYLNVAPHWLWHPPASSEPLFHLSFDYGPVRFAPFVSLEREDQLHEISTIVEAAVPESLRLRSELSSLQAIATAVIAAAAELRKSGPPAHWPAFNAGVAAALTGDIAVARTMFEAILDTPPPPDSVLHPCARRLLGLLGDAAGFRAEVLGLIEQRRAAFRLAPLGAAPF